MQDVDMVSNSSVLRTEQMGIGKNKPSIQNDADSGEVP